ncbi:MAG: DUF1206 domain-containing protein [Sulfitobacter sp.]|nr:DUF1206 domain-containing protein [Sulfitobacter sp.]
MRTGYGARGAIYVIVGTLALWAAFSTSQASGTKGALSTLQTEPLGNFALWAIAAGLFAYMIWRVVAGAADVEDHGADAKGLFARGGQITTGLLHGLIGLSVAGLAAGGGGSGGGAEDWTAQMMSMPFGRWIVGLGAAILAGAGAYYAHKGWSGKYKEHLAGSGFTARVDPLLTAGLVIYGGLLILVAFSIAVAALNSDPSQAGGLGEALHQLRSMTFGRFLLGGAALGLIAFALYNFVEAAYRVVPKISGPDVKTLKGHLKDAT